MAKKEIEYIIPTLEVDPEALDKLDTKSSSREKDGQTIKMPSQTHTPPIQIWEVYTAVVVLSLQPFSSILTAHIKALCEHNEPRFLCETVLKEHTTVGTITDIGQEVNLYSFLEEYFMRKYQITFVKNSLFKYVTEVMDDPLCGRNNVPRAYLMSVFVQAMLLNTPFFDGQYDELVDAMRLVHLPVNDFLADDEVEIGEAVGLSWDNVKLYDDPNLILKKYGGWAITKGVRMLTPKDQLCMRLTGCTLEQLLKNEGVPDSPRENEVSNLISDTKEEAKGSGRKIKYGKSKSKSLMSKSTRTLGGKKDAAGEERGLLDDDDSNSSHPSDFEVNPEHPKIVPIGVTLSEMYVLLRGLLLGLEAKPGTSWSGCIVGEQLSRIRRDGHVLAASVLIDLYMREQVEVFHWTLQEGSIAAAYRLKRKEGLAPMDHFLDEYSEHAETIFRDMRLPAFIGEEPIWGTLEQRGVIANHRTTYERVGIAYVRVDLWDLARPDLILDVKESYLTAARVLYDRHFGNPLESGPNDLLMFSFLLQNLFDYSFEAVDGMSRVLKRQCAPFEKGELFAPVTMVHTGAVCMGLIDRAFQVGNGMDTHLAMEAAEFNEIVMERLEEKFFLSPNIWQSFDTDQSGELSMEEFVEGMRNIDVYKDFRKEKVPDAVLRMIVGDLAERLFQEVDINMDGTLTQEELQAAFHRRREEALKMRDKREWFKRMIRGFGQQVGLWKEDHDEGADLLDKAKLAQRDAIRGARVKEQQRRYEWNNEVDKLQLQDEDVDVHTNVPINGN